jgi:Uma2 family endonuclease
MTIATAKRMSLEEFLTYDDDTPTRYELEDGILIDMGTESPLNTWIAIFLVETFLSQEIDRKQIGFKHLIQVDSTYVTARDPDLIIHSKDSATALGDGRKEACLKLGEPNPLLIIEAVSPGTESTGNYKRDYERKPKEYAQRGIPEMWQIDPARSWVRIGTLVNGNYEFNTFTDNDPIISPTFPTLTLTATAILTAGD